MIVTKYGTPTDKSPECTYSPAVCTGIDGRVITGNPDPTRISTSYAERQNLTMRVEVRRFIRVTNGFSKKVQFHAHAVILNFMNYNFARPHQSLRVKISDGTYSKRTNPTNGSGYRKPHLVGARNSSIAGSKLDHYRLERDGRISLE